MSAPCFGPCGRSYSLLVMTPKGDYCVPCHVLAGKPEPFTAKAKGYSEAQRTGSRTKGGS